MRAGPLVSVLGSANRAASVKGMRKPFYLGLFLLSSSTTLRIPPQWKYSKYPLPASYLLVEGRVLPTAHLTHTKCSLLQIVAGLLVHWSRKWNNISWKTKMHISFDSQKKKDRADPRVPGQAPSAKMKVRVVVENKAWSQPELSSDPIPTTQKAVCLWTNDLLFKYLVCLFVVRIKDNIGNVPIASYV